MLSLETLLQLKIYLKKFIKNQTSVTIQWLDCFDEEREDQELFEEDTDSNLEQTVTSLWLGFCLEEVSLSLKVLVVMHWCSSGSARNSLLLFCECLSFLLGFCMNTLSSSILILGFVSESALLDSVSSFSRSSSFSLSLDSKPETKKKFILCPPKIEKISNKQYVASMDYNISANRFCCFGVSTYMSTYI